MKHMFITCWAIFALALTGLAQTTTPETEEVFLDTLIIRLERSVQVRLIGSSLKELTAYKRADSLKTFFLQDLKQAVTGNDLPKDIHYLVSAAGKRRMKLKTDAYNEQEFNLAAETYRLNENLPAYHFIIYDLGQSVQIHLYIENSSDLKLMEDLSINTALAQMAKHKKEVNHSCRLELQQQLDGFVKTKNSRLRYDQLEITPDIRVALVANQPVPVIGADLSVNLSNKYGVPSVRVGANMLGYTFVDFTAGKFVNTYYNYGANLFFAYNINQSRKNPYWFGVEGGLILGDPKRYKPEFPGTGYSFALNTSIKNIGVSFGSIRDSYKNSYPVITVRLPF